MRLKGYTPYLIGLGSGASWGLNSVLIGLLLGGALFTQDPLLVLWGALLCSALHDSIAALYLVVLQLLQGRTQALREALRTRDALYCIAGAVLGGPVAMSLYLKSIELHGAALTASVTACYPLIGTLLSVLFLKEQVARRTWLGLLICLGGVLLTGYTPEGAQTGFTLQSLWLPLLAACGWASEAVVCAYGMKSERISPETALVLRELSSSIVYLGIVIPLFVGSYAPLGHALQALWSTPSQLLLLLAAAFVGVASFLLWYTAIHKIGAAKALCFNVSYAFWAVLFSFLLSQQSLSLATFFGSLLIIGGVSFATLTGRDQLPS